VWQTWQSLASTLSAFQVNVTTDADVVCVRATASWRRSVRPSLAGVHGRASAVKRVERWRDSGLTTAEFAAEVGISAKTHGQYMNFENDPRHHNDLWMTVAQAYLGADPLSKLTAEKFDKAGVSPISGLWSAPA
jgi:hypothetical protein